MGGESGALETVAGALEGVILDLGGVVVTSALEADALCTCLGVGAEN